jgi:hypothetical protein
MCLFYINLRSKSFPNKKAFPVQYLPCQISNLKACVPVSLASVGELFRPFDISTEDGPKCEQ